jgi:D-sedoheptulose 7-phosphate isomerase
MKADIQRHLRDAIDTLNSIRSTEAILDQLLSAAKATSAALRDGHTLLIAGNGGSAADAQHVAAEFVGRFVADRPALRAVALTTDTSCLTCIGNDFGFDRIFERQIEALGTRGDVFLAISTSGTSPNIIRALKTCRSIGITTFGLTGGAPNAMGSHCDYLIAAPSVETQHIQQAHLALEHIFCGLVERFYFADDPTVSLA